MLLLNQPFDGQLGNILEEKLMEPYTQITIFSAFAKTSGVLRLKPSLMDFKEHGGNIEAFIGVDAHGTSYEAVLNLFEICDELYIIHSESGSTTFHSKIYALSRNENLEWMAIGSNNLTSGGLWSNFESATCLETTDIHDELIEEYNSLIEKYKNPEYDCSMKITSVDDIYELKAGDYLRTEERIRQNSAGTNRRQRTALNVRLFGTHRGIHVPRIATTPGQQGQTTNIQQGTVTVHALHPVGAQDDSERMWVETRRLTGGSRNILDLSKLGLIQQGDASDTRYETDNARYILGSVTFFDIPPEDTTIEKDITINYDGVDYPSCTIKFAPNNGSWRIQIKGESQSGEKLHSLEGDYWLCNKILVFEKIRTDYYVLSVLSETELETLTDQSIVVAYNGSSSHSKRYGIL